MAVTFSGDSLLIVLDTHGDIDVQTSVYSDWKEWVQASGSPYPQAFDVTGGDPIPGGQAIAPTFFLRNDLGWRIRPFESDGEVNLIGNLYPRDETIDSVVPTTGNFAVLLNTDRSRNALVINNSATNQKIDRIWTERGLNTADPVTYRETQIISDSGDIDITLSVSASTVRATS